MCVYLCNSHAGSALYTTGGAGQLTNSSLIFASSGDRINQVRCLSGSLLPNVGQWFSPGGGNLAPIADDAFEVTVGDSYNPGFVALSNPAENPPLAASDEGVYTCVIPDETGVVQYLYVGIYLDGFSG